MAPHKPVRWYWILVLGGMRRAGYRRGSGRAAGWKGNRKLSLADGGKHGDNVFAPVRRVAARERSGPIGSAGLSFWL